jgi:murein DD-endopeptidase MepM/ murein hydrolase activator NlpD
MKDQIIWAKDKIVSGFNNMRDMVGSAFSAMVENVKGPVRTLFGWINRNLIGNINSVTGIFGLRIPLLPVNFNKGGVVPGGGPNKDSQLAALTPGEGVLTRQTTNALGGKAGIDSLNKWGAVGGPLDFIGDAWGAVKGQIGQWLRKGVGFALDQIMGPVNAAIRALLPDGFVKDFVLGIMTNLRSKMKSWGDTKDAAANVGGTPGAANPGWTLPLPRGSYRIGVGLHGYPGHTGQDLPAAYGTPVFAAAAGVISKAAALVTSYGKNIFIDHPGGYQTRYAHMAQLLAGTGQSVGAGALIGRVDSTGNSTGNHLHFEVRRFGTILNPRSVVGFDNGGVLPPGLSTVFNGTGDFERLARIPNVDRILSELRGDISTMIGSTFVDAMSSTTRDIRRAWVGGAGAVGGIGGLTDATGRVRRVASNRAYTMPGSTGTSEFREIHFHGDLSFPNVKDGSDAERFLENLEGLARG